jgi:antitoxin FitA
MAAITIRRLSDQTHERLKARAARAGRSTEAEIRAILEEATAPAQPKERIKLGDEIHQRFKKLGGVTLKLPPRNTVPRPIAFE